MTDSVLQKRRELIERRDEERRKRIGEVMKLWDDGYPAYVIAGKLSISESTVRNIVYSEPKNR